MNSNVSIILMIFGVLIWESALGLNERDLHLETDIPIYVYWCAKPATNVQVNLLEFKFDAKLKKGKHPDVIACYRTNQQGKVMISIPTKLNPNTQVRGGDNSYSILEYGLQIRYSPEDTRFYSPIDSIVRLSIGYGNGNLDTFKKQVIDLLPLVNADSSEMHLKRMNYYTSFYYFLSKQYIEAKFIMIDSLKQLKTLEYPKNELDGTLLRLRLSLLNQHSLSKKLIPIIDSLQRRDKMLSLQNKILSSEIRLNPINQFNAYYPSGVYDIESLSDETYLDIYTYIQQLRFRYERYTEWLKEAHLPDVRLKILLDIKGFADASPYRNCNNLLLLCKPTDKNKEDSCNQCLSALRAQSIAAYIEKNCSFPVSVLTTGEGANGFLEDMQQRRITIASIFVLESTKDSLLQPVESSEKSFFSIQKIFQSGHIGDISVPHQPIRKAQATLHLVILSQYANYQQPSIITSMSMIATATGLNFAQYIVKQVDKLYNILDTLDIDSGDVIWLHYFTQRHEQNVSPSMRYKWLDKMQKARLVVLITEAQAEGKQYKHNKHLLNRIDARSNIYQQLFNKSKLHIEISNSNLNQIASDQELYGGSRSYDGYADYDDITHQIIYTIETMSMNASDQTWTWEEVLKKAVRQYQNSETRVSNYQIVIGK